jgi:hypothetical protein
MFSALLESYVYVSGIINLSKESCLFAYVFYHPLVDIFLRNSRKTIIFVLNLKPA